METQHKPATICPQLNYTMILLSPMISPAVHAPQRGLNNDSITNKVGGRLLKHTA